MGVACGTMKPNDNYDTSGMPTRTTRTPEDVWGHGKKTKREQPRQSTPPRDDNFSRHDEKTSIEKWKKLDIKLGRNDNHSLYHEIKSWLGTVARNTAKNKLRTAGQTLPLEDDILILEKDSAEEEILRHEQNRFVRQAVLAMPYPDREIFLRHYYYGQKLETIAQEMDFNLSTVKTRLRRGREKLRSVLEQEFMDKGGT